MYNLPHYKETDQQEVVQFMKEHPFVTLTGVNGDGLPVATQVPVFVDEKDGKLYLSGHIMRQTDHHRAFQEHPDVLALFMGPHAYVSATWYDNPQQASTWNYMTVHARGRIRFGEGEELIQIMKRLTLHYENGNSASTTYYDNLSEAYLAPLMKAIVSFEIELSSVDAIFKLSQNRNKQSFENIIEKLSAEPGDGAIIAAEMDKRKTKLYPA